jgi:hypothetical protein
VTPTTALGIRHYSPSLPSSALQWHFILLLFYFPDVIYFQDLVPFNIYTTSGSSPLSLSTARYCIV